MEVRRVLRYASFFMLLYAIFLLGIHIFGGNLIAPKDVWTFLPWGMSSWDISRWFDLPIVFIIIVSFYYCKKSFEKNEGNFEFSSFKHIFLVMISGSLWIGSVFAIFKGFVFSFGLALIMSIVLTIFVYVIVHLSIFLSLIMSSIIKTLINTMAPGFYFKN